MQRLEQARSEDSGVSRRLEPALCWVLIYLISNGMHRVTLR